MIHISDLPLVRCEAVRFFCREKTVNEAQALPKLRDYRHIP